MFSLSRPVKGQMSSLAITDENYTPVNVFELGSGRGTTIGVAGATASEIEKRNTEYCKNKVKELSDARDRFLNYLAEKYAYVL
jgi:hypothetical protein